MLNSNKIILIITVDVEEDDWGYDSEAPTVENIKEIKKIQNIFDRYEIKPSYLVTFPVASCKFAVDELSEIISKNKCEIGSHLHPWNTPPIVESPNVWNSMLKNLPYELQVKKLLKLTSQIENSFEIKPRAFRAGRWAAGPETFKALIACGYRVDSSVIPMTYLEESSSYEDAETEPYWLEKKSVNDQYDDALIEIPVTVGFNRWPFNFWLRVHSRFQMNCLKPLHPIGILHHTGLLRKCCLSPEISPANDMITLTKILINHGKRILNLSFHSNSLMAGRNPFVRNKRELEEFYKTLDKYFEFLGSAVDLVPLTLSEVGRLF